MSIFPQAPKAGDIVEAYLPTHISKGMPGPDLRLNIVLGLEIDPANNGVEGLWLCRLSPRLEKIRAWDYVVNSSLLTGSSRVVGQSWVLRTPRVDLLPVNEDYFGGQGKILGSVTPQFWEEFQPKLEEGQNSKWAETTYGPRAKLPHTVAVRTLGDTAVMKDFDHSLFATNMIHNPPEARQPQANDEYGLAQHAYIKAMRIQARSIQADFMAARLGHQPWDYKSYSQQHNLVESMAFDPR